VVFRPGRVSVRFGRKVKLVRPHLSLAGEYDTWTSDGVIKVVVGVHIDDTGAVTQVDILHSSGSNEIDLPCLRAVQQWWIEPLKDKSGKPRPDVIVVTLLIG
jgi:TonB family protein